MNNIIKAIAFAKGKHKGQKYGEHDYFYHLEGVAKMIYERFAYTKDKSLFENCIAIVYLHDVLEDTDTSLSELVETFGEEIANCVLILTRNKSDSYLTYLLKMSENYCCLLIKLADLTFNITESQRYLSNPDNVKERKFFKQRLDKYILAKYIIEGYK